MERKAQENLEAARALLGLDEPCTNAATSRAYYAAYHSCWALMADAGRRPPTTERGTYFSHKELPEQAKLAGVLNDEESELLEFLEGQRVVADYFFEDVTANVARDCVRSAEMIVARTTLGG
jgi:uncharacterized protein (UPF0332 family)